MRIAANATAVMVVATWRLIAPPRVGLLKRLDNPHSRDPGCFRCLARFLGDFVTKPCAQLAAAAQTSAGHLNRTVGPRRPEVRFRGPSFSRTERSVSSLCLMRERL